MIQRDPVHVLSVGAFGEAVARALKELLPDVVETTHSGHTSTAQWPIARLNILAAWRPVPTLSRLVEGASYAWRIPSLTVVLEDPMMRVGPVVVPGIGACSTCYEKRILQHTPRQAVYAALFNHYTAHPESGPQGYLTAFAEIAATRLVQQIHHLERDPATEAGRLWQMDMMTRNTVTAQIIGAHGCPRCGLQRDEATRSYKDMQRELSSLLPWGTREHLYRQVLKAEALHAQPELAHMNGKNDGHGGNV